MEYYIPSWNSTWVATSEEKLRLLGEDIKNVLNDSTFREHFEQKTNSVISTVEANEHSDGSAQSHTDKSDNEHSDDEVGKASTSAKDVSVDVCGSFPCRTLVYPVQTLPCPSLPPSIGSVTSTIAADLVVTIPETFLSKKDINEFRFSEKCLAFLALLKDALLAKSHLPVEDENSAAGREGNYLLNATLVPGEFGGALPFIRCEVVLASGAGKKCECSEQDECEEAEGCDCKHSHHEGRQDNSKESLGSEKLMIHVFARPVFVPSKINSTRGVAKWPEYAHDVISSHAIPQFFAATHKLCSSSPSLMRTIIILKAWAHHFGILRRASINHTTLVGSHRWQLSSCAITALVLHLASAGLISGGMSEEAAARVAIVQIARGMFDSCQLTLKMAGFSRLNFLAGTSALFVSSILKPVAEESLQYDTVSEVITRVLPRPFIFHFNTTLSFTIHGPASEKLHAKALDNSAAATAEIQEIIQFALADRLAGVPMVEIVTPLLAGGEEAHVGHGVDANSEKKLNTTFCLTAHVFLRVKSDADARSRITKGPLIEESAECEIFAKFWGSSIISTRQFADGSIRKCVWWGDKVLAESPVYFYAPFTSQEPAAGTTVPADVVLSTILHTAFKARYGESSTLNGEEAVVIQPLLAPLTAPLCETVGNSHIDAAPLIERKLDDAVSKLSRLVDAASGQLACKVLNFCVVSPAARGCAVFNPRPHACLTPTSWEGSLVSTTPAIEPLYAVLSIDDKGKIPNTLQAVNTMKGALYAELTLAIERKAAELQTTSGTKGGEEKTGSITCECFCTKESADCIIDGFLFRIYLAHYREVSLLRALDRQAQADLLEQKLFWTAQHHRYIKSSIAGVYPTYTTAVRIAKRWTSGMLLAEFVTDELVELVVAAGYSRAPAPHNAEEGFFRYLSLVATHDWSESPLFVTAEGEMGSGSGGAAQRASDIEKIKENWDKDVQGVFIVAFYDTVLTSPFTKLTPRPMIVTRWQQLARGALQVLTSGMPVSASINTLFSCDKTSANFDFILPFSEAIILHYDRTLRDQHCRALGAVAIGAPFTPTRLWRLDELSGDNRRRFITQLAELEPARECLRALRAVSRDQCMLFADECAPDSIAVVLLDKNPSRRRVSAVMRLLREAAPEGYLEDLAPLEALPPAKLPEAVTKSKEKKDTGLAKKRPRVDKKLSAEVVPVGKTNHKDIKDCEKINVKKTVKKSESYDGEKKSTALNTKKKILKKKISALEKSTKDSKPKKVVKGTKSTLI